MRYQDLISGLRCRNEGPDCSSDAIGYRARERALLRRRFALWAALPLWLNPMAGVLS